MTEIIALTKNSTEKNKVISSALSSGREKWRTLRATAVVPWERKGLD